MTQKYAETCAHEDTPSPFAVVFDEFHYMNDPSRGSAGGVVISSSENTKLVALSATVSNDEQLKGWMRRVHGPTEVVSSSFRPVPLKSSCVRSAAGRGTFISRRGRRSRSPEEADDVKNGGARQRAKKRLRLNPLLEQVMDRSEARVGGTRRRGQRPLARPPPPSAMRCADVARDSEARLTTGYIRRLLEGLSRKKQKAGSSLQLLTREESWRRVYHSELGLDEPVGRWTRRVIAFNYSREASLLTAGLLQYKTLVEDAFKTGKHERPKHSRRELICQRERRSSRR